MIRRALLTLLALLVLVGAFAFWLNARLQAPYRGFTDPEVFVDLAPGTSVAAMADRLAAAGVVSDARLFRIVSRLTGADRRLQAGEDRFVESASVMDVVDRLAEGDIYTHPITFPEGLTIAEMAGVSDGLAYRYFSSKDEIIKEAVQLVSGSGEPVDPDTLDDDVDATLDMVYRASAKRFSLPDRETTVGLRMRSWSEALENEDVKKQVLARWAKYAPVEEEIWSKARNQGRIAEDLNLRAVTQVMQAIHDGLDLRWALEPSIDVEACYDVVLAMIQGHFNPGEEDE